MPAGKSKKVVHFGAEVTAPEEAADSDESRCSEDRESPCSNTGSRGSIGTYNPADNLEYVGLASSLSVASKYSAHS